MRKPLHKYFLNLRLLLSLVRMPKLLLSVGISLLLSLSLSYSQTCQDASVELSADIQKNPARITLHWVANAGATQYTVTRKLKTFPVWGAVLANLPGTATEYVDSTVIVGGNYEYRLIRSSATYTGYGYINAGIEVPLVESRGNLILVVDQTFATSLQPEIDRWINDAQGDGWRVTKIEADRNASSAAVKAQIKQIYDASSPKAKCLFILGHVPVPYSGELNPDGHPDHVGAWPTDAYYADINGSWTDETVNNIVAGDARNKNIPGDGKFDQSMIPTDVEMQVGRVDFANMPSFSTSEEELLRNYLNKDHAFRQKLFTVTSRGLIDDNFGYFNSEAFASSGYKNIGPIVGPNNVVAGDYLTTMADSSYLWSYGCGPGWFQGAGGIGSTTDFASSHTQSVFTMLFGSYFGDWDSQDNFLRAPLAQGLTLTNAWSGRPHWLFHPMALGETIGYCARLTQNNNTTYFASYGARFVSIGLMGDPTLRNDIIAPASNIVATNEGYHVKLMWDPSADEILGYNIYRKAEGDDDFVRLNNDPVTKPEYVDSCLAVEGDITYMVRALNLQHTPSGSYFNMSEGVTQKINHVGTPDVTANAEFTQEGQVVTFTNTSSGAVDHVLWLFGDGDTSNQVNPMHQYHDGAFQAALIVSNECRADTFYMDVLILTGTKDIQNDGLVTLSPNPSSGNFTVSIKGDSSTPFQLYVYSADGNLVLEKKAVTPNEIINATALDQGVYALMLEQGKQVYRKKIVILAPK